MTTRPRFVYGLLLAVWAIVVIWQVGEHYRVKRSARAALINRSRDITTTLGIVIRSQRFRGLLFQERLEPALKELVKSGELSSVALENGPGEVVASAGPPIDTAMVQAGEHWEDKLVTVVNLVDLGVSEAAEGNTNQPTIVLPPRPAGPPRDRPRPPDAGSTNSLSTTSSNTPAAGPASSSGGLADGGTDGIQTNSPASRPPPPPPDRADRGGPPPERGGPPPEPRDRRSGWRRPPWMSEKEYESLLKTRGLHRVVIAMSTEAFQRTCRQDLWMRFIIGCFACVSAVGVGSAWQNLSKSAELQMRLLRASELNSHLKEMNLAAAGLAHETRNPLNIIRGLAQMVSKQEDTVPEVRRKLGDIVNETDRVTAQLNEFINYSRPREVRRSAVPLNAVIGEVVRALNFDLEEKGIQIQTSGDALTIEADEQLLRQSLFNLLLNAIQVAGAKGEIRIAAGKRSATEASLEVQDNGPGVPEQQRAEIFKPYFTTHAKGTGLGLAVVQQIVLAHGWEIECLPNSPKGAIFRITHLKLVGKNGA